MIHTRDNANLDLMRSMAVLFVVFFHVLLLFGRTEFGVFSLHSLGQWGVLLFFVHTSLVLMFSLERQEERARDSGLAWVFYLRRCFRVYPLSILIVVVVAALRLPVGDFHGTFVRASLSAKEIISNILLVQNITHTDSIIAVLWSLPFEMQMYLILPPLYLVARQSRNALPLLGLWMGSVLLVVLASRVNHFAGLLLYIPCFLPGIVAYKLGKTRHASFPFVLWPVTLALVSVVFLQNPAGWMGWTCCLLVGLAIPQFREMSSERLKKACQFVARYSYGIYLTHVICLWMAFYELRPFPMAARWIVFVCILVAIPVILYHFVEAPMIAYGTKWVERRARKPFAPAVTR